MVWFHNIRPTAAPVAEEHQGELDIDNKGAGVAADDSPSLNDSEEEISKDAQVGVQKVEALASVWTRNDLIAAYIM